MSWKKWLLLDVLVGFLALTVWVLVERGAEMVRDLWSPTGLLIAVDLTIALTLSVVWLWRDARARGGNPLPFVILTALTGSAGPLLYMLLRRPGTEPHLPNRAPVRV